MTHPLPNTPSESFLDALRAVDSMTESGIVAVPFKPTLEMLTAGSRAGGISVEKVWEIYRAMICAAP